MKGIPSINGISERTIRHIAGGTGKTMNEVMKLATDENERNKKGNLKVKAMLERAERGYR